MSKQIAATSTQRYWDALKEVMDPEFPISVVDMGLIYEINQDNTTLHVKMTYTSTGCACMHWIESDIRDRLLEEDNVENVEINVVWEPAWTVDNLTEEGKKQLRRWGVRA
ncbi:metal-sulfur cluster assembly factor [Lentibacillus salinarum]|uniref:Metal-sulfur cluster assembly factor n=1 Tax=Lentibacillus salinarum TaxID=446820 RepID=A0ABW3ZSL3_9BACI